MAHPPAGAVARRSSGAFTLIELLVTVVIIALLAGLAMAGYSKVLESARKTEAISNMRNIGQGILTYAADNNNRLPGPLWPGQIPLLDPNPSSSCHIYMTTSWNSGVGTLVPKRPRISLDNHGRLGEPSLPPGHYISRHITWHEPLVLSRAR
jgi:prepilin-type N-terminal cleavage/methylation domain-containing protein